MGSQSKRGAKRKRALVYVREAVIALALILLAIHLSTSFTPAANPAGSGNLITEGSNFEVGFDGFIVESPRFFSDRQHYTGPAIDEATAAFGRRSLRLVMEQELWHHVNFKPVILEEGKTYTLSLHMKADVEGAPVEAKVWCGRPDGGMTRVLAQDFRLTTDWQRYSVSGAIPDLGWDQYRCWAHIWMVSEYWPSLGTLWIDGVQLEEGILTPYQMANPLVLGLSSERKFHLFYPDEEGKVKVSIYNESAAQRFRFSYRTMDDYYGEELLQQSYWIDLTSPHHEEEISLPVLNRGFYRLIVHLEDETGAVSAEEEIIWGVIHSLAGSQPDDTSFFGTHVPVLDYRENHGYWNPQHKLYFEKSNPELYFKLAEELGMQWVRLFHSFELESVEPEAGQFDFTDVDNLAELASRYHLELLPVLSTNYYRFPEWAEGTTRSCGIFHCFPYYEETGYLPNLEVWSEYVYQLVNHFKDRIKNWEAWNESYNAIAPEDFVPILANTHSAAKRADPEARIVCEVVSHPRGSMREERMKWVEDVFALGALDYCDVVSIHSHRTLHSEIGSVVEAVRDLVEQQGMDRTIEFWDTERGAWSPTVYSDFIEAVPDPDGGRVIVNPAEQADNVVSFHLLEMAAGLSRSFYFNLQSWNSIDNTTNSDLLDYDDAPRPALIAYNAMVEIIGGATFIQEIPLLWGDNIALVFEKDSTPIAFVWDLSGQQVNFTVPLDLDKLEILDIMGNEKTVEGRGNGFVLPISSRALYLIGTQVSTQELINALSAAI